MLWFSCTCRLESGEQWGDRAIQRKRDDSQIKERLRTLRQLERGFSAKDGFRLNELTAVTRRKINAAYKKYDDIDLPTSRIVAVPRNTPDTIVERLQNFARYKKTLPKTKIKGVLLPSTIATDEKLKLIPAHKRKKNQSAVVYYKDGKINTGTGYIIDKRGAVGLYEKRARVFSTNAIDLERIKRRVKKYIDKNPAEDLWEVYLMVLEDELIALEKTAGELWYLIVTPTGPTRYGGTRRTILGLLEKWAQKYRDANDPFDFVTGLRVFLTQGRLVQTQGDVRSVQATRKQYYKDRKKKGNQALYKHRKALAEAAYKSAQIMKPLKRIQN